MSVNVSVWWLCDELATLLREKRQKIDGWMSSRDLVLGFNGKKKKKVLMGKVPFLDQ